MLLYNILNKKYAWKKDILAMFKMLTAHVVKLELKLNLFLI